MARAKGRPSCRWTADTEIAFLLALRLIGSVAAACREIGRSEKGASVRRRRLPDFAARWQAALDENLRERTAAEAERRRRSGDVAPDGGEGGEMPNRVRYDGWTPLRQRAFLRVLSETGTYEQACRAVRISTAAARAMRREYPSFAQACDRALERSAGTLEQVAYERAVEGWDEPIVHAGRIVGQRRRYSEPLLRLMLQRETARENGRETGRESGRKGHGAVHADATGPANESADRAMPTKGVRGLYRKPPMSPDEVTALLMQKLDRLDEANAKAERRRMLAWEEDMVRRGLAP